MPRLPVATSALPTEPGRRAIGSSSTRSVLAGVLLLTACLVPALAAAGGAGRAEAGDGTAAVVQRLALEVAVLLAAARVLGEVVERYLMQPAVPGEFAAGIVLGPYALGQWITIGHLGALFPAPPPGAVFPVSAELNGLAQIGAILLLFRARLETDVGQLVRVGPRAVVVATGGVVVPFVLGAVAGRPLPGGGRDRHLGRHLGARPRRPRSPGHPEGVTIIAAAGTARSRRRSGSASTRSARCGSASRSS